MKRNTIKKFILAASMALVLMACSDEKSCCDGKESCDTEHKCCKDKKKCDGDSTKCAKKDSTKCEAGHED